VRGMFLNTVLHDLNRN